MMHPISQAQKDLIGSDARAVGERQHPSRRRKNDQYKEAERR